MGGIGGGVSGVAAASPPARRTTVVVKTREFTHFDEVPDQEQEVAELSGILTTADRLLAAVHCRLDDRSEVVVHQVRIASSMQRLSSQITVA